MSKLHTVFVSYHHVPEDAEYREKLEKKIPGEKRLLIQRSVKEKIPSRDPEFVRSVIRDENLKGVGVTVVLVGPRTWARKFVDWEIMMSLRPKKRAGDILRSGLLGLVLPHHPSFGREPDPLLIPARLWDNVKDGKGYALLRDWSEDPDRLSDYIHKAYNRRTARKPGTTKKRYIPTNSRAPMTRNLTGSRLPADTYARSRRS